MQVKKQQLRPDMEQQTGPKLGKEYIKAVCCHPAYLTSMQSTSRETLGWMKHKLESRLPGVPDLEPVCCSMSSSNCCFLTCIQVSQEAGQMVWYSHLFQNFPQFIVIHTVKGFGRVNKAGNRNRCFSGTLLLFP